MSGIAFIVAYLAYASTNNIKILWIEMELFSFFFISWVDASHVYMHALSVCCFHNLINTQTFWRMLTAPVVLCAVIKVPLQWCNQFGRVWRKRCWKARLGVCVCVWPCVCVYDFLLSFFSLRCQWIEHYLLAYMSVDNNWKNELMSNSLHIVFAHLC